MPSSVNVNRQRRKMRNSAPIEARRVGCVMMHINSRSEAIGRRCSNRMSRKERKMDGLKPSEQRPDATTAIWLNTLTSTMKPSKILKRSDT